MIPTVDLLVIPRRIDYNGETALMSGDDRKRFIKLVESAREGLHGINIVYDYTWAIFPYSWYRSCLCKFYYQLWVHESSTLCISPCQQGIVLSICVSMQSFCICILGFSSKRLLLKIVVFGLIVE